MSELLAYIPFLEPINVFHDWWYLLIVPLAFGISVVYKAMRLADLSRFWRSVSIMTAQIVIWMVVLAIVLTVLVQVIVPQLPVRNGLGTG